MNNLLQQICQEAGEMDPVSHQVMQFHFLESYHHRPDNPLVSDILNDKNVLIFIHVCLTRQTSVYEEKKIKRNDKSSLEGKITHKKQGKFLFPFKLHPLILKVKLLTVNIIG